MRWLALGTRGKRGGRVLRICNSLSFFSFGDEGDRPLSFVLFFWLSYFFPLFGGSGRRGKGRPAMIDGSDLGQDKVM